ncbi:MAG: nitrate/nitrite transporter NrtS, partial [SAR324 cluster bacterium]|nr:nitrate/nitrite transporter NrtS [SAR324 cluster bacterium]
NNFRRLQMTKYTLYPDFSQLAFMHGTPKRALMTLMVVGTILTLINNGDVILEGGSLNYIKFSLSFCIPFCVSTWGSFKR